MATSPRTSGFGAAPPLDLEGEFHISRYLEVIRRRRLLLAVCVAIGALVALLAYFRTPRAYRATTVLQIERRVASPVKVEEVFDSFWDAQSFLPTQIQLLTSRGLAERVARRLSGAQSPAAVSESSAAKQGQADDDVAARAQALMGGLTVNPIASTRMVSISYTDASPLMAARVANEYADAYMAWGIEGRAASTGKATSFLETQVKALKADIENGEERLRALEARSGAEGVNYLATKGEVDSRRALLGDLLKRQAEIELTSGLSGESNVTIVDRALVPGSPFRPSLVRNLPIGIALGLVIGFLAMFLAEHLDRSINTPEDVDRVLRQSVLGVIPNLIEGRNRYGYYGYGRRDRRNPANASEHGAREIPVELVCVRHPRLAISEAYRSLRTTMMLSTANSLKTVLVTSAVAGEGKTVTASNLSAVLAQLGHSVLLIDADLRKPRQHELFGVSNRVGLVSALTRQAEVGEVIQQSSVNGLSLIPSGPIPPQPSELLASDRMRDLLAQVRGLFDFVVIDSPPVLPVTDAAILSAEVDGVLLCVGAGQAVREDAQLCIERLSMVEARILGVVLNRRQEERGYYKGKYYHHYYARPTSSEASLDGQGGA
jgi:capsular exopolysaccharide synthesis family protein